MPFVARGVLALTAGVVAGVLGFYAIRSAVEQTVRGEVDAARLDYWLLVGLMVPLAVVAPLVFAVTRRPLRAAVV